MGNRLIKILAIDDNVDNLISLKALIKEAFPETKILTSLTGEEGLALAAAEDPDMILLDIIMPNMDGFEVCQKLKTDPSLSDIPVVFITALKGDKVSRIRALEAGAEAFLTKPIDESELTAQIRAMVKIKTSTIDKREEKERLSALVAQQTMELKETYTTTLNLLEDLKIENQARKKSEDLLRENEVRLNQTQRIANLGSWELDILGGNLFWSDQTYRIFGLLPQEFEPTYNSFLEILYPEDREAVNVMYTSSIQEKKDSYEIEHRIIRRKTGEIRYVHEKCEHIKDDSGTIVRSIGMVVDITERKLAEAKIKNLLAEKELILKEVHHRIKNNMNTIVCLLHLQSVALKDPSAIRALNDAESRVHSMMVLYDKLYQSVNFNEVQVNQYLPTLVDEIIANFPNSGLVKIEKKIDDFVLGATELQSFGIIINELLTNIMKYAFTDKDDGVITVSALLKGNRVSLVIEDNGSGMPESINFENSPGFGLMLVKLLTKQIDGTIRIERENGTRIILEFEK